MTTTASPTTPASVPAPAPAPASALARGPAPAGGPAVRGTAPAPLRSEALIVAVLSLGAFMSSLDVFIVNLAFPYIARDYSGTDLSALSWVLNAYTIVLAAALVPAGLFADRIGRRRIFVAGLATFAAGSLLCGLAPNVATLVAARVIQATGAGMVLPASLSLLLASVGAERRTAAIGTWSAIGAMGASLGPVIGGLLVQWQWRSVFWVNVPVGVVAIILAIRVLPESRGGDGHRPDLAGAALFAVAVGALALAVVRAPEWGWASAPVLGLIAGSLVTIAAVVRRSSHHAGPVVDLALLRHRNFSGALAASVVYYAGFGALLLNAVEFLTGVWHYSAIQAGLAIAPGPLLVLPFARIVSPRLAARLGGSGRVALVGITVTGLAQVLWFTQIQAGPAFLTHLLASQIIGGAGVGLTLPSLIAAGTRGLEPARFGSGSGVLNMGRQLGTVIGVSALIAVLTGARSADPVTTYRLGVVLVIALLTLAAVTTGATLTRAPAAPAPVLRREGTVA
jgi:EmrB/QacA subfamily drug resistance transporter